ncbi:hypothetical protein TRIUR3_22474 [Triticum urartu]|nr:hypothetical protein TRIUR3_22474 [Triticum urartu]
MRCCSQEPVPEAAWTSFMTACHRDGLLDEAIYVFRDMVSSGVPRSSFSLSTILAVCAESENCRCYGQQVHGDAIKHGVETDQFVMSGLVHMYAKQGRLADATRAFEAVGGKPDAVCWNAMAMGYARGGRYREATRMMYQMKAAGLDLPGLNVVGMACSRYTDAEMCETSCMYLRNLLFHPQALHYGTEGIEEKGHEKYHLRCLALATYCHYLWQCHYAKEEFYAMTWFSNWAVDGDHNSQLTGLFGGGRLIF